MTLSPHMENALADLARHGELRRLACGFVAPGVRQHGHQIVAGLISRGLAVLAQPRRGHFVARPTPAGKAHAVTLCLACTTRAAPAATAPVPNAGALRPVCSEDS